MGGTLAYGVAVNRLIPQGWHVPANLAAAAGALALARWAGAGAAECGVGARGLGAGARVGAMAGGIAAAGVAVAALPGKTRRFFSEERVGGHGEARAAYELLIRIPVATALGEEVLFRGAMLGIMLRRHPRASAVARTSLCFGVWHVLPALASLRSAALGRHLSGRLGAAVPVIGAVGVTTAAGIVFAELRLRSGSVVAPALAHATLNAAGYLVARRTGAGP